MIDPAQVIAPTTLQPDDQGEARDRADQPTRRPRSLTMSDTERSPVFRRIELINTFDEADGRVVMRKHGLMGIAFAPVVDAWIGKLRGPFRTIPHNARFYFTEAGWREVGRPVVKACRRSGQDYRIIAVKEKAVAVVWRDEHTGYEVAAQPKKARH